MKKTEVTYCGMQERSDLMGKFEKIFNALFLYLMVLLAGVGLGYYWCFKAIGG